MIKTNKKKNLIRMRLKKKLIKEKIYLNKAKEKK